MGDNLKTKIPTAAITFLIMLASVHVSFPIKVSAQTIQFSSPSQESRAMLIILNPELVQNFQETYDIVGDIEKCGARILWIYPPHVLIGYVSRNKEISEKKEILGIFQTPIDISILENLNLNQLAYRGIADWNKLIRSELSPLELMISPPTRNKTLNTPTRIDNLHSITLIFEPPYPESWTDKIEQGWATGVSYVNNLNGGVRSQIAANPPFAAGVTIGAHRVEFIGDGSGLATLEVEMIYGGGATSALGGYANIGCATYVNGEIQEVVLDEASWGVWNLVPIVGQFVDLFLYTMDWYELTSALVQYPEVFKKATIVRNFEVTTDQEYGVDVGLFAKAGALILGAANSDIIGDIYRIKITAPDELARAPTMLESELDPATGKTLLKWRKVQDFSGVAEYQVEIDDDPDFSSPDYTFSTQETSLEVELPKRTYYWRVRTLDRAGNLSPWSSVAAAPRIYDFSNSSNWNTRVWAWEGRLDGLPSSPQAFINATETEEASTGDYQKLAKSDSDPWVTEKATKNGEYDAQLYRFKISEDPRRISSLSVEWEGKGEPYSGCETDLWIWNFEKNQWEQLDFRNRMTSDEWLGDEKSTNVMDYVSNGYVYVLARAEHYAPQDFSIAVSPSSASVTQGGSTTATVNISTVDSYTKTVSLKASGVPSGVSVSFSPTSGTPPFTSTMSISVGSGATTGTHTITVTGTGADGKIHSTTFTLKVTAYTPPPGGGGGQQQPTPDFSISVSPSSPSVYLDSSTTVTVKVDFTGGYSRTVELSVSGVPQGITASLSQSSGSSDFSATLTISASSSASTGTSTLTITGTGSDGKTRSKTLMININKDTTAPTITLFHPSGTSSSPTEFYAGYQDWLGFTAKDSETGVAKVIIDVKTNSHRYNYFSEPVSPPKAEHEYYIQWQVPDTIDMIFKVKFIARDATGNESSLERYLVVVEKTSLSTDYVRLVVNVAPETTVPEEGVDIVSGTVSQDSPVSSLVLDVLTRMLSINLKCRGIDLHVYDPLGRHIGMNYETGEVEIEIPNAEYSGPDACPEWVRVRNPTPGLWRVEVYGREVVGREPFTLRVSTDIDPPAVPELISPADNSQTDNTPHFEWASVTDP